MTDVAKLPLNFNLQTTSIIPQDHIPTPTRKKQEREGTNWSRSGCLTCKKRRKRCDETKPSCNNCVRLGRVCEGYGSMWAEPLGPASISRQSGQKRRRISLSPTSSNHSGEVSESNSNISTRSTASRNLLDDDIFIETCLDSPSIQTEESSTPYPNLAISPEPLIPIPHLSSLDSHYLQYHVEQGSKLLANLENDENPLRSLLIPRAMSSPLLMKAMCAMSAMHLANRSLDGFSAQTAATNYYIQTMRAIRGVLAECSDVVGGSDGGLSDDVILAVGLLCKYEIVRGSVKQWAVHLDAIQKLISSRGGFACLEQETAEFIWGLRDSFMYAHNVAKITNRKHITGIMPDADCVRITKLDIYIGYTEDIIKLCARISELPSLRDDPVALDIEVRWIDEALRTWSHTNRTYIIPTGITPATLLRLQMVAECFRDAAYIYLHSILERMFPSSPAPFPFPSPSSSSSSQYPISTAKPTALTRCLARISTFHLSPHHCEYSALTFPLFIAGCECHGGEEWEKGREREIVLWALVRLEGNFGIGNVGRVKEILGVLWNSRSSGGEDGRRHWLDVLEELGWDLILA